MLITRTCAGIIDRPIEEVRSPAAQTALEKAFAQDKRDLEAGNHQRYYQAHLAAA